MKQVLRLITTGAALWIAIQVVPGLTFDGSEWAFVIVTLLLFAASALVKPILALLSLPLVVLTLGLFMLIVNALVLQLVVWLAEPERLDAGLASDGFWWATFLGALVISIMRVILDAVIVKD